MNRDALAFTLLLALAPLSAARAQGHAGLYTVQGQDPRHGAFTGRVELRPRAGGGYDLIRVVEQTTARHATRRISVVWTGRAADAGSGVSVTLLLDRMGWASTDGTVTRTVADGVPAPVTGTFFGSGAGLLSGMWSAQGTAVGGGLPQSETWARSGPIGAAPLWRSERTRVAMHGPANPLIKSLMFALFNSFHRLPIVQPHVSHPQFQAGIHFVTRDPTDFAVHRQQPDLLRVIQQVPDPLALAEAAVKSDAYGQTLRRKAELADAEAPTLCDPTGALAFRSNGLLFGNGDGGLWTGVYALSQSLRFQATQDPAALANLEAAVRCAVTQADIDGDPARFARTLRTASGQPVGGATAWNAGTGRFQGIEWLAEGNNDMFKGFILAGVGAHEALPPGHPLRAELARVVAELGANSPVCTSKTSSNGTLAFGVAAMLDGSTQSKDEYRRRARNPFGLLLGLVDGGFLYQGISDWSGNHLGFCGVYSRMRVAHHLGETVEGVTARLSMRMAEWRLRPSRAPLHSIAAAGRQRLSWLGNVDTNDALWSLREVPMPRALLGNGHGLRADHCLSPYPAAPWKFDWTHPNERREHGIDAYPWFERMTLDYRWKDGVFQGDGATAGIHHAQFPSADYLFAYWLARVEGLVGPNE